MRHYPVDHPEMERLVALHASLWQPVRTPNSDVVIAIPEALEALDGSLFNDTPPGKLHHGVRVVKVPPREESPHVVRWTGVAHDGSLVVAVGNSAKNDEPLVAPSNGWRPRSDFTFEAPLRITWQAPGFVSKARPVSRLSLNPLGVRNVGYMDDSTHVILVGPQFEDASVLGLVALTEALLAELPEEAVACYREGLRLQRNEAHARWGNSTDDFSYGELDDIVSVPDLRVLDYLTRNGVRSPALVRRCQFARAYPLLALAGLTEPELDARVVAALPMEEWVASRCRMSPRVQRFLRVILPPGHHVPVWLLGSDVEPFLNACTPETLNALAKSYADGGSVILNVWHFLGGVEKLGLLRSLDKTLPFSLREMCNDEHSESVSVSVSARRAKLLANSLEVRGGKPFDDAATDLFAHLGDVRYALFRAVFLPLFRRGIKKISRDTLPKSSQGVSSLVKDVLGPSTLPMRRLLRLLDAHLADELRRNAEEDARGVDPSVVKWGARMKFASPEGIVLTALTSRDALRAEGRAMEHCVGDAQVSSCVARTCCILSLTDAAGARLSTAELVAGRLGRDVTTMQHYGPKNSPPPEAAMRALTWLLDGLKSSTLDLGGNMPQVRQNGDELHEADQDLIEPVAVLRERIAEWVTLWGHGARGLQDMLAAVRADDVLRVYHADVLAAVDAGLTSLCEEEQA